MKGVTPCKICHTPTPEPVSQLSIDFLTKLQTTQNVMFHTVDLSCVSGKKEPGPLRGDSCEDLQRIPVRCKREDVLRHGHN